MAEFQNGEACTMDETDVENQVDSNSSKNEESDSLRYGVDDVPPLITSVSLAMQQFLFTIGSVASFPVIMMPLLCYEDSQNVEEYRTMISSNCVLITGISSIIQSTFGSRLPTIQATSISYFLAAMSVFNSEKWRCPPEVTPNVTTVLLPNDTIQTGLPTVTTNGSEIETLKVYVEYDGTYRNNAEVWMTRLRMMQGSIVICGLTQVILGASGVIGSLSKYIGPLTVAPVLAMVTYALCDVILSLCKVHWGLAGITLATFYITSVGLENVSIPVPRCSVQRKGFKVTMGRYPLFSMFPVIFSIAVGWLVYFTLLGPTRSDETPELMAQINSVPWVQAQYPFRFGAPIFTAEGILGILVAIIPATLEAMGHFVATAVICQLPPVPIHAMNRGILCQGISTILFAMFGVVSGATFWTSNTTVISMTSVGSRRIFQYAGLFLIIASIFPKSISIFALMPQPVVGGLFLGIIGTIFSVGVAALQHVNMAKNRNLFVLGFSIVSGIVIPKYFTTYPESITLRFGATGETLLILLQSPMLIAGVLGFTFDNISPGKKEDRGLQKHDPATQQPKNKCEVYNLPFKTDFSLAKWIPLCPSYSRSLCGQYRCNCTVLNGICRRKSIAEDDK